MTGVLILNLCKNSLEKPCFVICPGSKRVHFIGNGNKLLDQRLNGTIGPDEPPGFDSVLSGATKGMAIHGEQHNRLVVSFGLAQTAQQRFTPRYLYSPYAVRL